MFTDRYGNEVSEKERFGLEQHIKLTKPAYLLFPDETGCNTSKKKDGNVAGTKFIVERGTVPQSMASTTDHRFILLPFTSKNGEAVCCVIIFQSKQKKVPLYWQMGFDVTVDPI